MNSEIERPFAFGTGFDRTTGHVSKSFCTWISVKNAIRILLLEDCATDADLILMDEPTASLDLGNRLLVLARVRALSAQGYGVVFSTHDPDQARELATRVAVIADGGLAAYGTPHETLSGPILSAVYGVEVTVERTESGRYVVAPRS